MAGWLAAGLRAPDVSPCPSLLTYPPYINWLVGSVPRRGNRLVFNALLPHIACSVGHFISHLKRGGSAVPRPRLWQVSFEKCLDLQQTPASLQHGDQFEFKAQVSHRAAAKRPPAVGPDGTLVFRRGLQAPPMAVVILRATEAVLMGSDPAFVRL